MLKTIQKQKATPTQKQNKKPTHNAEKITKKKLKNTRIVGGIVSSEELKKKLNAMLTRLKSSYFKSFENILEDKNALINAINEINNTTYTPTNKDFPMRTVNDALVLLLKTNTSSTEQDRKETLSVENTTEPDASTSYEKFKKLVKEFCEKIIKLKTFTNKEETPNNIEFQKYIYSIYTDGIVLLTIVDTQPIATVYKNNKNNIYIYQYNGSDNIAEFLIKNNNCLIVKSSLTNDNYVYDCMLQILSKLVKILLEPDNLQKYINTYLEYEVSNPVSSKITQINTDEVLNELIQAISNNIISEKYDDTYMIEKHKVLLRSLIFIRYGVTKNINEGTFNIVKEAYFKQFKTNTLLFNEFKKKFKYEDVVGAVPYFAQICTSDSMTESFQHILNAMSISYDILDNNKDILIKSSKGFLTSNCERTINKIIKTKSYLLSEPTIMSKIIHLLYINNKEDITLIKEEFQKFKEKIEEIEKIINLVDYKDFKDTKSAVVKIYTDLKNDFAEYDTIKIYQDSFVDNIEEHSKLSTINV